MIRKKIVLSGIPCFYQFFYGIVMTGPKHTEPAEDRPHEYQASWVPEAIFLLRSMDCRAR